MHSILDFYQNLPSQVDPFIFNFSGNFGIRWYSLAYVGAVLLSAALVKYRIKRKENVFPEGTLNLSYDDVNSSTLYIFFGIVIGARIGYVLFYDLERFLLAPFQVLSPITFQNGKFAFQGISGLSYHGAVVGFIVAFFLFTKKYKINFLRAVDFYIPTMAIAYTLGRVGNFMNGELYGRITSKPWGMYFLDFKGTPMPQLRHPSQLYEAFFEGVLVFLVLWKARKLKLAPGSLGSIYLVTYSIARFFIEFFREPDSIFKSPTNTLGTVISIFSMGQVLSIVTLLIGLLLILLLNKKKYQAHS